MTQPTAMLAAHVVLVGLLAATRAFFSWLAALNLRHGERVADEQSEWLQANLGVEDPGRLLDYQRAKSGLAELRAWTGLAAVLVGLYAGPFERSVDALAAAGLGPVASGVVFFVGVAAAARALAAPFDAYETFVVEEVFGFNRRTPAAWLRETVLRGVLLAALAGVLAAGVLALVRALPALWWAAAWLFVLAVVVALRVAYPRVVVGLFYDLDPVEGDLRETVAEVFERAGHASPEVYLADASSRSAQLNAYVTGLGRTKRVVLYDTLVEEMDREQLQSVLAHELAHLEGGHFWKGLAALGVQVGLVAGLLGYLAGAPWLYDAFGLSDGATYAGLAVGLAWAYPVVRLSAPIRNRVSTTYERRADGFAAEVMGDAAPLRAALCRLAGENLSNPYPHPLYAAFHLGHPPVPERVRYLRQVGPG